MELLISLLLALLVTGSNGEIQDSGCNQVYKADMPAAQTELELIRERLIAEILKPETDSEHIALLINSAGGDGSWPDIDYKVASRTDFDATRHAGNLVSLARAFSKTGSPYYLDPDLKKIILTALDFWIYNDFVGANWHSNEVTNPLNMARLLLIFGSEMTALQVENVIHLAGRANPQAWGFRPGGDITKMTNIMAKVALFLRDEEGFRKAIEIMEEAICFTSGSGLKEDFSFNHRTDRVNSTFNYGKGNAVRFAAWIARNEGTSFSFPVEKVELVTDYFLGGIVPMMVHGHYRDPGAMNRNMAGPSALMPVGSGLPEILYGASSYREDELKNIIDIRKGDKEADFQSSRFLWHSEYYSHQRQGWFASVRMHSSRMNNMEFPHNQSSLKHHHFADGSNFISITGQEYRDIFPVWDWQKIPGTTIVQKPTHPGPDQIVKQGLSDFVGGVTDSISGAVAFDFESPHDPLRARKSWFFFDREFVCLGSGISSSSEYRVATTMNQCLLEGDVVVRDSRKISLPDKGKHAMDDVMWVHHGQTAYIFTSPASINVENRQHKGSWASINDGSWARRAGEVNREIFTLWADHGYLPDNAGYEYIVVPLIDVSDVDNYTNSISVDIIANTPEIQSVRHNGQELCQIVFYSPGSLEIAEGITVTADAPGLVMVHTSGNEVRKITVSDPSRRLKVFGLQVTSRFEGKGKNWIASWNRHEGRSDIYFILPDGAFAGESVIAGNGEEYKGQDILPVLSEYQGLGEVSGVTQNQNQGSYYIGKEHGGGIIFWIDENGENGLIASKNDQSGGIRWNNGPARVHTGLGDHYGRSTNARGDGIYAGEMNTQLIVGQQTEDDFFGNFAARECIAFQGGDYGGWYLPSKAELSLMYGEKELIGGFTNALYWSSTEYNIGFVWGQHFYGYGGQFTINKSEASSVRCIRRF